MNDKKVGNLFVFGQFLLIAFLALTPASNLWSASEVLTFIANGSFAIGFALLILSFANLGKSLTANPVPLDKAELKTNSAYSIVRHPIYLALILVAIALTLKSASLVSVAALLALVVLLDFKARFEEKLLMKKFANYKNYAQKVGRLFPGIGRIRQS
jgi:protein-S-isoprenylcysteine O-methyltransferase Ste14